MQTLPHTVSNSRVASPCSLVPSGDQASRSTPRSLARYSSQCSIRHQGRKWQNMCTYHEQFWSLIPEASLAWFTAERYMRGSESHILVSASFAPRNSEFLASPAHSWHTPKLSTELVPNQSSKVIVELLADTHIVDLALVKQFPKLLPSTVPTRSQHLIKWDLPLLYIGRLECNRSVMVGDGSRPTSSDAPVGELEV